MTLSYNKSIKLLFLPFILLLCSCTNEIKVATYDIDLLSQHTVVPINEWNILGPIKFGAGVEENLLNTNYLPVSDSIFCLNPYDIAIVIPKDIKFNRTFFNSALSEEAMMAMKLTEMQKNDIDIENSATYYYCNISSRNDTCVYFLIRPLDYMKAWLNSTPIYNPSDDIRSEFIPLHLKQGNNYLVIKKINRSDDLLFKGKLCSKEAMIDEYINVFNALIVYPSIVNNDTLSFIEDHEQALDAKLHVYISNTKGDTIIRTPFSRTIPIRNLKDNCSYRVSLQVEDKVVTQPFYKGDPDKALALSLEKQKKITQNDSLLNLLYPYTYRLNALLNHESRKDDWWWPLKASSVIYELENLHENFAHTALLMPQSSGIMLKSYVSPLDNTLQYYILITPDSYSRTETTPLVVVMRPDIENHHHFLTSPQLARYWSIRYTKALADKYNYAIMVPCSRLYGKEELTPMAEAETIYAINDAQQCYNIDSERIYLHGNCLAGYRSLSLATRHPQLFAAIGLYAPVYTSASENNWVKVNSPDLHISRLKNTPIMVHFDPYDLHSPYVLFKKLIDDCEKNGISMTVSSEVYSGKDYHIRLVGEETLDFFKGKSRIANGSHTISRGIERKKVIADLYSQPFLYVYDASNQSPKYLRALKALKEEYENYFFSTAPFTPCDSISREDIINKNLFLIGHQFNNTIIEELISGLPLQIEQPHIIVNGEKHMVDNHMFQTIFDNPFNKSKSIVIYSSGKPTYFHHTIKSPWKDGLDEWIISRGN